MANRQPFKMRSGNTTSFKMMGSSPVRKLHGNQANIDMNNNNRIDAQDFRILNQGDSPLQQKNLNPKTWLIKPIIENVVTPVIKNVRGYFRKTKKTSTSGGKNTKKSNVDKRTKNYKEGQKQGVKQGKKLTKKQKALLLITGASAADVAKYGWNTITAMAKQFQEDKKNDPTITQGGMLDEVTVTPADTLEDNYFIKSNQEYTGEKKKK